MIEASVMVPLCPVRRRSSPPRSAARTAPFVDHYGPCQLHLVALRPLAQTLRHNLEGRAALRTVPNSQLHRLADWSCNLRNGLAALVRKLDHFNRDKILDLYLRCRCRILTSLCPASGPSNT